MRSPAVCIVCSSRESDVVTATVIITAGRDHPSVTRDLQVNIDLARQQHKLAFA